MTALLLLFSPLMWLAAVFALALTDLAALFSRKTAPRDQACRCDTASVVIPNWNGRDLLERYLPSVIAALAGHPDNEIIVVDNGSTDGSAAFVRQSFPQVKLLALDRNLGFGGGSNAGFRAARNDIVVLLNSDMRVSPDFLPPLLEGFRDERVFAVSCQIFFRDPAKPREETGLTQAWWQDGNLKVRHRADDSIAGLFPCFYGGGGSCAFDRAQVPRTRRLRRTARAFLSRRHRPRLHGLEARLEGALPAAQQGLSRASRHHRQALQRRTDPGRAQEKLPAVLLEKHPRMAHAGLAFLLQLRRRAAKRSVRRRAGPRQPARLVARISPASRRDRVRDGERANWPRSTIPKRSADPSAAISETVSRTTFRAPVAAYASCSSRPIPSVRRFTAAAYSCIRRCANLAGSPRFM